MAIGLVWLAAFAVIAAIAVICVLPPRPRRTAKLCSRCGAAIRQPGSYCHNCGKGPHHVSTAAALLWVVLIVCSLIVAALWILGPYL